MDVRVFVNGFTGQRGASDSAALSGLDRTWRKRGLRKLSFSLITGSSLFHAKVLAFERPGVVNALVGSANATRAAFADNEELMLMLRGAAVPRGLQQYLDAVAAAATAVDKVAPYQARNLASFFRGGDVYYRPTIVTSFRFDLRLPAPMRTSMARLRVDIAGITARAGRSYDPFAKAGLTAAEEREYEAASADGEGDATTKSRVPLRAYGVQTCYGWWVPSAYHAVLERSLTPARKQRAALLDRLTYLLDEKGDQLRALAADRFGQLETYAAREKFSLNESNKERLARFDALLERAQARLADGRWRRRAEAPYVSAAVPEIWSDPVSSQVFVDSFFDYLEVVAPSKKRPTVWRALADSIPALTGAPSSEKIRDELNAHLVSNGWAAGDWGDIPIEEDS